MRDQPSFCFPAGWIPPRCWPSRAQAGYACHALSLDYGQRHTAELAAAARVARSLGAVEHRVLRLGLGDFGGSALTDASIAVPESPTEGIPVTYVPARNTVMLSLALAWAEVLGRATSSSASTPSITPATPIAGPNSSRPSSRWPISPPVPAVEGEQLRVHAPLQYLSQGRNHPARHRTRRRLRANRELLSGRCRRPGLRPLRCLPPATRGLPRRRPARSDALRDRRLSRARLPARILADPALPGVPMVFIIQPAPCAKAL